MNFDNIEGLTDEDVNALYEDVEKLSTWYGTWCPSYHENPNSLCVNSLSAYATFGDCPITCEDTINFTSDAMNMKCQNLCGVDAKFTNFHLNAHSATVLHHSLYCHGLGYLPYRSGFYHGCYAGHYHSCFEGRWNYYIFGGSWGQYWTGTHAHPWVLGHSQCRVLHTR